MPVGRDDLARDVSLRTGLSQRRCREVLDTLIVEVICNLRDGNEVYLENFGTFSPFHHKAGRGRNPKTNEVIPIPAYRTAKFNFYRWKKRVL